MKLVLTPLALTLALLFLAGPALAQNAPAPTPSGPAYEAFQKARDEYRAVVMNSASTEADKATARTKFEAAREAWRTEQRASGNCTPGQGLRQGQGARNGSGPKANDGTCIGTGAGMSGAPGSGFGKGMGNGRGRRGGR